MNNVPIIRNAPDTNGKGNGAITEFFESLNGFFTAITNVADSTEMPPEHFNTHMPPRKDCGGCLRGKLIRTAAKRSAEKPSDASEFLDRVHIDIVGPVGKDVMGNRYIFVARDQATDWPYVEAISSRSADTMRDCLLRFHAGQRKFAKVVVVDNDKSFEGSFAALCTEKQCYIHNTVPYRSTSNSRAERFSRTLNEGVRTFLATSGMPYEFWGFAAEHFVTNYRNTYVRKDGKTAFYKRYNRQTKRNIYPWGAEVFFHNRTGRKFGQIGLRGIIVGYGESNSLWILDCDKFVGTGEVELCLTKDFKYGGAIFPLSKHVALPRRDGSAPGEARFPDDMSGGGDAQGDARQEAPRESSAQDKGSPTVNADCDFNIEINQMQSDEEDSDLVNQMQSEEGDSDLDNAEDDSAANIQSANNEEAETEHEGDVGSTDGGNGESESQLQQNVDESMKARHIVQENDGSRSQPSGRAEKKGNTVCRKRGFNEIYPWTRKYAKIQSNEEHEEPSTQANELAEDADTSRKAEIDRGKGTENSKRKRRMSNSTEKRLRVMVQQMLEDSKTKEQQKTRDKSICDNFFSELFGAVARPIKLKSEEGQSEKMKAAIHKEQQNHAAKGTWDYSKVMEYDEARKVEGSEFVRANLILVEKDSENADPEKRRYKARLVALGDNVRDAFGRVAEEEDLFGCPISMSCSRFIDGFALLKNGCVETADVDGAYLQAKLNGSPKFLFLPREMWLEDWHEKYKNPAVPIDKALYGVPRAGFDWQDHAAQQLEENGWTRFKDVQRNLFTQTFAGDQVLLGLYVDDLKMGGAKKAVSSAWASVKKCFKLGEEPQAVEKFTGIWHSGQFGINDEGLSEMRTSQSQCAKALVERFKEDAGLAKLKRFATPGSRGGGDEFDGCWETGKFSRTCRRHIGGLLFLARGSRPDIMFCVGWLARHVEHWCRYHDRALARIFGYIDETVDCGIVAKGLDVDCQVWLELTWKAIVRCGSNCIVMQIMRNATKLGDRQRGRFLCYAVQDQHLSQ